MLDTKKLRSFAARLRRRFERSVLAFGNTVQCTYCGWTGLRFMSAGSPRRPNRLCPSCGSLERYRMLPLVMTKELGGRDLRVLEIAPKACFSTYCTRQTHWRYVSSDLSSPYAMVHGDLRAMPFGTGSFDAIVCFHVMEHIHEDGPAFGEIGRMLKHGGIGIINVPIRGQITQEGASEVDWERLYGQADHVRYYGMDIEDRMRAAGLTVRRVDALQYFTQHELDRHGLRGDDRYLFLVQRTERV